MFFCGIVLRCIGKLKPGFNLDELQLICMITTIVHSYKLLINNVKRVQSLSTFYSFKFYYLFIN